LAGGYGVKVKPAFTASTVKKGERHMKTCELIEYLSGFDPEKNVSLLILDLKTRKAYKSKHYQLMSDADFPVLLFEMGEALPEALPLDDIVEEKEP
jgi:hypothetical protein